MEITFRKFLFSCIAILVLAAMAIPDFAKISHAINEHKEITCLENRKVHFHEVEFNCDFHKYHITSYFSPQIVNFTFTPPFFKSTQNQNYYFLLSEYQKLHFSLRGPPVYS